MKIIAATFTLLYPLIVAAFWARNDDFILQYWGLWGVLNILCVGPLPLVCGFFACMLYLDLGYVPLLLLACGVSSQALCYTIGSLSVAHDINMSVTIFNGGVFIGAFFHFSAAVLSTIGRNVAYFLGQTRKIRLRVLLVVFGGTLLLVACWIILVKNGLVPPFFVQGVGGTFFRTLLLTTAITFYGFSAACFIYLYGQWQSGFQYWYILALIMVMMSQLVFIPLVSVGSYLNWIGRFGLWASGLFFALAVWRALKRSTKSRTTMAESITAVLSPTVNLTSAHIGPSDSVFKVRMQREFYDLSWFKDKYGVLPHQAYIMFLEGRIQSLEDLIKP